MLKENAERLFHIQGATERMIRSKEGQTYRIMVWKPNVPAPAEGFPVYYLLDGDSIFATVTETIRLQSMGPRSSEAAVVVGIGYSPDQPLMTQRRFYDYTLHATVEELPVIENRPKWPESGGIESYLSFIEEDLKPYIEEQIPTNRDRQALFGHSLGGFFTLYTLFTRPTAFQYYASGSPSIWWKQKAILNYAAEFIEKQRVNPTNQKTKLFIGIGRDERPDMVTDAHALYERLQSANITNLQLRHQCYKGENHISVLLPFISQVIQEFRINKKGSLD